MNKVLALLSPRQLSGLTDFSKEHRHRAANNWLSVVVICLGMYLVLTPFLPVLRLWWRDWQDDTGGVRYSGLLAEQSNVDSSGLSEAPKDNRLVIPSIILDEGIVQGADPSNVHRGVWQRPLTSTPDKGSNTVLVAHRFSYSSPATFYHLDQVKINQKFAIWWEGKEYVYEVFAVKVVAPSEISIEAPTDEAIATLYTCTPVWTAENRLVVQAKLVNTDVLDQEKEQE